MSRYRKISVRIWNDAKFAALCDDGKLAFFFVLTHPHMTALGAMRATVAGLAAELGWKVERLSQAFLKASEKGLLSINEGAKCVFLPNFIKHNPPESPNVVLAWTKALDDIPECELKTQSIQAALTVVEGMTDAFRKASERLRQDLSKSMPYQEHEQEHEQEKSLRAPAAPRAPRAKSAAVKVAVDPYEAFPEVPRSIVEQFIGVRQSKRAGLLTELAVAGIRREAGKAGLNITATILMCVEKNWTSFDSTWSYPGKTNGGGNSKAAGRAAAAKAMMGDG